MEVFEIIMIIAAIVGILSFIYIVAIGNESLSTWWHNRKRKGNEPPPGITTPDLAMDKTAIESRIEYDRNLRARLLSYAKHEDVPESWVQMLNDSDSLTAPACRIPQDSYFIDCICTVLAKEGKTIAIMPSGQSYPDFLEGIGRTCILLKLLGLSVNTGRLIGLQPEDLRALKNIPIVAKSSSHYSLLATDMAYLGCVGGRLSTVSTKGERMSFVWDLARHIYRITTLGYMTGDHRKQPGRDKLLEIFNKISFKSINGIFGHPEKLHTIDEIFLLRRELAPEPIIPQWRELKGEERQEQIKKAIMVPAQHGSMFWHRDKSQLELRAKYIVDSIDTDRMPSVSEVRFSGPEPGTPDYIFDEITERIRTKENPPRKLLNREIRTISGISLHNNQLSLGFRYAQEVRLLITSGEKIFRESSFWNALSEARSPIILEILMLDPDSYSLKEREQEAYSDKPKGFLKKEIQENIETIKRMSDILKEKKKHAQIVCGVYSERPSFRMTFIGKEQLLVASYEKGIRTGEETVFYEFDPHNFKAMYCGFEREYQRFRKNSRIILGSG